MEIASTSDYRLLIIEGEATEDQCQEKWETIVQKHNYHNGNQEFFNYINHLTHYRDLINEYNTIKSSLIVLAFTPDNDIIVWLNKKGYRIDTSTSEKYAKSIDSALRKSDSLNTKMKMKFNQLKNFNEGLVTKRKEIEQQNMGLEERLAHLSFELGYSVQDDITLARYNEYVKLITKNNGTRKARHNKG